MNVVAQVGLSLLAFGALSGWVVVLRTEYPDVVRRIGVKSPRRLLQAHIDYIIMGVILIAVGTALPDLATWNRVALIVGTIVNPTLFLPLAFREDWSKVALYRVVTVASFATMSVGTVGAAVAGLSA
jgi:cell division protein FtsW (lipid II flippase)